MNILLLLNCAGIIPWHQSFNHLSAVSPLWLYFPLNIRQGSMRGSAAQWESKSWFSTSLNILNLTQLFLFVFFPLFFLTPSHLISVSQKKLYSPSPGLHSRCSRERKLKETKALFVLFAEAICSFGCLCISLQLTFSQEKETLNASWNESKWKSAIVAPPPILFFFNQIQTILAQNRHKRGYNWWIYGLANWQTKKDWLW